jgi:hypothetical protein
MTDEEKEFHEFMKAQEEAIQKYKWIESQKAGRDLGLSCVLYWIDNFAKKFREDWGNKK